MAGHGKNKLPIIATNCLLWIQAACYGYNPSKIMPIMATIPSKTIANYSGVMPNGRKKLKIGKKTQLLSSISLAQTLLCRSLTQIAQNLSFSSRMSIYELISQESAKYPKPNITFSYGTAGFRDIGTVLVSTVFRMGLLAALRSKKCHGEAIGVMITASHNKEEDNGIKLVDPKGDMLHSSWETYCTLLANAQSEVDLISVLKSIANDENIDLDAQCNVLYACDTRPTSPLLVEVLERGLSLLCTNSTNFGVVTTPQLHYFVLCINTQNTTPYGIPTIEGYNTKIGNAYRAIVDSARTDLHIVTPIFVDCANGVGAKQMQLLSNYIGMKYIKALTYNDDTTTLNKLNVDCGADYVKTNQKPPPSLEIYPTRRCCSFDGDADRLVYYFIDNDNKFKLLDGDKIASLIALHFRDLLQSAGITKLNLGVVQTAYANGSSTKYMRNTLKLPVSITNTGVKYLHHVAQNYDIGVYFEANGHGSVLFSKEATETIKNTEPQSPAQKEALHKLCNFHDVINEAVGDAMSGLLLVEAILLSRQWTLENWDQMYSDMPNKLLKVKVANRNIFQTTNAEQTLVSPDGLQEIIDSIVCNYPNGRSFVRPSGTEDAVRVYAEASTANDTNELAYKVAKAVYEKGGGIGPAP
ncbi:hypothetical protein BB561_005044 [Smittium simulii]|uniref:Phosphoacetylglucosamine mutase n=1 Tax=Smittium simulii TaxID=133385 RepID=A0A2T9YCJ4_9FUNG|nr:hypothetical protein BB561_005044 [Smittium simulii]